MSEQNGRCAGLTTGSPCLFAAQSSSLASCRGGPDDGADGRAQRCTLRHLVVGRVDGRGGGVKVGGRRGSAQGGRAGSLIGSGHTAGPAPCRAFIDQESGPSADPLCCAARCSHARSPYLEWLPAIAYQSAPTACAADYPQTFRMFTKRQAPHHSSGHFNFTSHPLPALPSAQ